MSGKESLDGHATAPSENIIQYNEKAGKVNLYDRDEHGGLVLDINLLDVRADVKTAADGRTILYPQPSSDPNDPLNWSSLKKHTMLFVISVVAFMPDFTSATGAVTLLPQSKQWHQTPNTIQRATVGNIFCLGAGGLVSVWLSAYFGRLPILFYFISIALGTIAWCAAATTFHSYLAARILNGFFSVAAEAGGLMFIQDVFFFHEHPRKINFWSGGIIVSPYLGPMFTAFIINKTKWPVAFWVGTGLTGLCWLLIIAFMDETIYNRALPPNRQPIAKSRVLRLLGIEQWRNRHTRLTFSQAVKRPLIAISKLPVLLGATYYFLNFAWIIGVNATLSVWLTEFYKFTPYNIGFFYFAPIIGSVLGAVFGHWLHDLVGKYYMRRHNGRIEPEARLIISWLAEVLMAISVLMIGIALQHTWHHMIVAVFFGGQVMGIMIATTALNAYLLDAYPEGSGDVGAWVNVGRTMGGFMATYIEINWVIKSGPEKVLGTQAGISFASLLIILFLQVFGRRIRQWQGRMNFPEVAG